MITRRSGALATAMLACDARHATPAETTYLPHSPTLWRECGEGCGSKNSIVGADGSVADDRVLLHCATLECYAARTVGRNFSTSVFSVRLSPESVLADERT